MDLQEARVVTTSFVKYFEMMLCKKCKAAFQPVEWLPYRVDGYCRSLCQALDLIQQSSQPWTAI